MPDLLIRNATIVNNGQKFKGSVVIDNEKIVSIVKGEYSIEAKNTIDATGLLLIPGVIDDQVHFRDPGLTHKGDLFSESRAAAERGVAAHAAARGRRVPRGADRVGRVRPHRGADGRRDRPSHRHVPAPDEYPEVPGHDWRPPSHPLACLHGARWCV